MEFEPHTSVVGDFIALVLIIVMGLTIGFLIGCVMVYQQINAGM